MLNFFKKKKTILKEEVNIKNEKQKEEYNKDIDESVAEIIIQEPIRSINTSDVVTPHYSVSSTLNITPTNEEQINKPLTPLNTPVNEKISDIKIKINDLNEKNKKLNNKLNYLEYYYNKEIEYIKYGSIVGLSLLSYYLLSKKNNS